jgi:hypothetical protein
MSILLNYSYTLSSDKFYFSLATRIKPFCANRVLWRGQDDDDDDIDLIDNPIDIEVISKL